jgi:hypothetical protein
MQGASMRILWSLLILCLAITASACELVGDIFQAGFWVGTIVVIIVLIGAGFLFSRIRR